MIGKMIGAFVGEKVAEQTDGIGGAAGAVLGVVAATVLRRMSLPGLLAVGVGGYLLKRYADKQAAEKPMASAKPITPATKTAVEKAA